MSLELRQVTLRRCRQYLAKMDQVNAMAEACDVIDEPDQAAAAAQSHAATDRSEDQALLSRRSAGVITDEAERTRQPWPRTRSDQTDDRDGKKDTDDAEGKQDERGRTSPVLSPVSTPAGSPVHSPSKPPGSRLSYADVAAGRCSPVRTRRRPSVTQSELGRLANCHRAFTSITTALRRGISRLDAKAKAQSTAMWDQARASRGRFAIKPKRPQPRATWRGNRSSLREVWISGEWHWEEEVRLAMEDSGICFKVDRKGRRVSKL